MEKQELKYEILKVIEKNSKLHVNEIAAMLKADEAEVAAAIAEMEEAGIICGYNTLINWEHTTHEKVTALIEVEVTPQRGLGFDKIAERIYQYEEVNAVYLMSGAFDLTVIIEGKTMKEVALFVSNKLSPIDSVLRTATHFVLKKYKDHGTVMVHQAKSERMKVTP
ncbi:MAG: Lrp/AsnC family transcriptional regulator [Lachnospiraceae bacterium]